MATCYVILFGFNLAWAMLMLWASRKNLWTVAVQRLTLNHYWVDDDDAGLLGVFLFLAGSQASLVVQLVHMAVWHG
jgi:hypothetical protein